MKVRPEDRSVQDHPPDKSPPLLSLRAIVLLMLAAAAAVTCYFNPLLGIAIGVGVAVLTLLNATVGD